jgi:hypothetical protein
MNKLIETNPYITFGILTTVTIALAIIGMAAEVMFITNHLELVARQVSLLSIGGVMN